MILRKAIDVGRIVEVAVTLHLNQAGIVLLEALQASTPYRCCMSTPVGCGKLTQPIPSNVNSAVYNWN